MSGIRDAVDQTRRGLAERLTPDVLDELRAAADAAPGTRSLTEVLSLDELALVVEPKRAPRRRLARAPEVFDVAAVLAQCVAGGAAAVSVVTEPLLSGGSIDDLRAARAAGTELPLVARDFVVHVAQVWELRAAGADALLLPVCAFDDDEEDDAELARIVREANRLGMEVVLSVRTADELVRALDAEPDAINVDNRDGDGQVDVELTMQLLAEIPVGNPVLSESVASLHEVAQLHKAGVDGLLLDEGHLDEGLPEALRAFKAHSLDQG